RSSTTGAVRAFVHFAARTKVADLRILGRSERARIEAVSAADAEILVVQHDTVLGRIDAADRTDRRARRIRAVHASHRDRALARLAIIYGDDAPAVDSPRHFVLVLAGGNAGVAVDATIGIAKKFHARHRLLLYAGLIWQSVAFGSCMPVAGSKPYVVSVFTLSPSTIGSRPFGYLAGR